MERVHLVFSQRLPSLEAQLMESYDISGWSPSLEEAIIWAKSQSESADLLLINGLDHYRRKKNKRNHPDLLLIEHLGQLQHWRPELRIILFLPEKKNRDQQLLVDLMKINIYDFWFQDTITIDGLIEILKVKRDLDALEAYLKELPLPEKAQENELSFPPTGGLDLIEGVKEKISLLLPRVIKDVEKSEKTPFSFTRLMKGGKDKRLDCLAGGSAYYWSENNAVGVYAVAVFQALSLAMAGHKTILVELPQPRPYLAESLGLRHPRWNVQHAMELFKEDARLAFESCMFNGEHYRGCASAYDRHKYLQAYPKELFFLPGLIHHSLEYQECDSDTWEDFLNAWTRWAVFCQKFKFLIFVGVGIHPIHERMIEQLTYFRVNVMESWPSGYNLASAMEKDKPGENLFLWSNQRKSLTKERRRIEGGIHYVLPNAVCEDFLALCSFEAKPGKMSGETWNFIELINRVFLGESKGARSGDILLAEE